MGDSIGAQSAQRPPIAFQQFAPNVQNSNQTMLASGNRGAFEVDLGELNRSQVIQEDAEEGEEEVQAFNLLGRPARRFGRN